MDPESRDAIRNAIRRLADIPDTVLYDGPQRCTCGRVLPCRHCPIDFGGPDCG